MLAKTCTAGLPRPLLENDGQNLHRWTFTACSSGDVGQTLHRLTFPARSPGTLAKPCTA